MNREQALGVLLEALKKQRSAPPDLKINEETDIFRTEMESMDIQEALYEIETDLDIQFPKTTCIVKDLVDIIASCPSNEV